MNRVIPSLPNNTLGIGDRQQPAGPFSEKKSLFNEILQQQESVHSSVSGLLQGRKSKILVGKVSSQTPTVSELLIQNKELKHAAWHILSSPQNQDQEYTKLTPGTPVYYDRVTGQLSWPTSQSKKAEGSTPAEVPANSSFDVRNAHQVSVGVLSSEFPTVSHLLQNHPELSRDMWDILAADANKDTSFDTLPPGTRITYNQENRKILCELPSEQLQGAPEFNRRVVAAGPTLSANDSNNAIPSGRQQPIFLGKIGQDGNPTISHMLQQHEQFNATMWQLLSSEVNRHKPFHQIAAGAEIYIDQKTNEISWKNEAGIEQNRVVGQIDSEKIPPGPALDLTEAVKPLIGKTYHDLNCYELLVEGLQRMDIPYGGRGGLYSRLVQMARKDGLSVNAYLNGEGIVKAAGSTLMARTVAASENWQADAERFYREIEPLLDKGQILSFSTRSRGHTGIISKQDEQWTFINSGRLDNSLTRNNPGRGVGEEVLKNEIGNWFKLARNKKQDLLITLGQLEQDKIVVSSTHSNKLSTRI